MTGLDRDEVVEVCAAAVGLLVAVAAAHQWATGRDLLASLQADAADGGP